MVDQSEQQPVNAQADGPEPVIAIDLGSNSCVGLYNDETQDVIILESATGSKTTPTLVGVSEEDEVTVGEQARN